jgi:hypothetical protein
MKEGRRAEELHPLFIGGKNVVETETLTRRVSLRLSRRPLPGGEARSAHLRRRLNICADL